MKDEIMLSRKNDDIRKDWGFKYAPVDQDALLLNLNPHYTDERYRYPQTIYRRPNVKEDDPELIYDYSDRLYDWDHKKASETYNQAFTETGNQNTARFFSAWLSKYYGKIIVIQHIMSGWNWGNGYPYLIFGYDKKVWNQESTK